MSGSELLSLTMRSVADLSSLRAMVARAGRECGLAESDLTRLATSASEVGRQLGTDEPVAVVLAVSAEAPAALEVRFDLPTPSADPPPWLDATRSAAVLVDDVRVARSGVTLAKRLPQKLDERHIADIRTRLLVRSPSDRTAELQSQNKELIDALVQLREREDDLVRVNAELDRRNHETVGLYAELERRSAEVRDAQRAVFAELENALRPPPPDGIDLDLAVRYLPAQANSPTGGDLYDWFVLGDGTVLVTVVDVLGHGVTGTRNALLVTHAVRTLVLEGHELPDVLRRVDQVLTAGGAAVAATALLGRLDSASGQTLLAGAGHPLALHVTAGGGSEFIPAEGRPLGVSDAGSRRLATMRLAPDDTLLLYTDGLIEVRHDIVEGMETLRAAAAMAAHLPLAQMLDTVVAACARGDEFTDDTLLLGVRRRPQD